MNTKHNCGGPIFGRKTAGCPRCDELLAGAEPRRWNTQKAEDEARRIQAIKNHACTKSRCGIICTKFDW